MNEQEVWYSLSHSIKKVIEKRREHAYWAFDMYKIALGHGNSRQTAPWR